MATFTADKAKSGVPARRLHAGVYTEVCRYSSSATLSAGDVIQMCKVQAGERVVDVKVGAAEPVGVRVGDGLDPNRYVTDSTAGAATVNLNALTGLNYEYTASDTVDVTYLAGQTAAAAVVITAQISKISDN